ncbi:MAG: hypothetical protein ACJ777_09895 [Chloroflexota bacterium]
MTLSDRRWGAIAAMTGIAAVTVLAACSLSSGSSTPRHPSPAAPDDTALVGTAPPTSTTTAPSEKPASSVVVGSAGPTPRLDAEPTRVIVAGLRIDLPVVRPLPNETFPLCDVAEFLPAYGLPGLPGVTYLYGHARTGMFLPMLQASRTKGGAAMLGMEVRLYTSDLFRRTYKITEVHRKVASLDVVNDLEGDALVLQTSETSHSSGTKLVVVARPTGQPTPASENDARPAPRPRRCS